jgi:hypothetical protein
MLNPMSDVRRLAAATVVAAVCLLGIGSCQGDEEPAPSAAPSPSSTPLAELDTAALVVRRDSFCPDVDPDALEEALGGDPDASTSYDNGEPARLTRTVEDVAHEFDCTWQRAGGTVARAWVFAPPVTAGRARALVREAQTVPGCTPVPDASAFGSPSVAVGCRAGRTLTAAYHGLFGDAWLSCSLAVPVGGAARADLVDRAGRWCVAVATAASGSATSG